MSTADPFLNMINTVDEKGLSLIHYAARNNDVEFLQALAARGADLNKRDKDGRTALHYTAIVNNPEATVALLQCGAAPNETDEDGRTALHFAGLINCAEMAVSLLEYGAALDIVDNSGSTPLGIADRHDSHDVLHALCTHAWVADIGLTVRVRNVLARHNILTLNDLVTKTEAQLLAYKNLGHATITEIQRRLTEIGLISDEEG